MPFVTPISRELEDKSGRLVGTGSYFARKDGRFVVTNAHVAAWNEQGGLGHQFLGSDLVFRFRHPFVADPNPTDVAISAIDTSIWMYERHEGRAIPIARFAAKHDPVDRELLFYVGYTEQRERFYFDHLITPGTPYATQEMQITADQASVMANFQPQHHFVLPYPPSLAQSIDAGPGLPNPPGMSGSLVWNTRRVEYHRVGREWTPDAAQVTGIVWGWLDKIACVFATRVEHLHECLNLTMPTLGA